MDNLIMLLPELDEIMIKHLDLFNNDYKNLMINKYYKNLIENNKLYKEFRKLYKEFRKLYKEFRKLCSMKCYNYTLSHYNCPTRYFLISCKNGYKKLAE